MRSQLNSVEVLRILNGLEHARSTYADAFIDVHRDLEKVQVMLTAKAATDMTNDIHHTASN